MKYFTSSLLPTWTSMTMASWTSMWTSFRTTMFGMRWISIVSLFQIQYYFLPIFSGVFICFSANFFQPPRFLPTSLNFSERRIYFLSGINLFSQAICKKKERVSSRVMALSMRMCFLSVEANIAWCTISRVEINDCSIFAPSPYRAILGIWGAIKIQSEKADFNFWRTIGTLRGGGTIRRMNLIHTYDNIISIENLLLAWREFVKGLIKKSLHGIH